MSTSLRYLYDSYQSAKTLFNNTLKLFQQECEHARVIQHKGVYYQLIDSKHPGHRACLDCALQETSAYSWAQSYSTLTSDFIMEVDEQTFYQMLRKVRKDLYGEKNE